MITNIQIVFYWALGYLSGIGLASIIILLKWGRGK